MSGEDFERLALYRNKRGPLNPVLRMEAGFALVASTVLNAAGAKKQGGQQFTPDDFMPWAGEKKEAMDVDAMILEWARSSANG